MGAGDPLPLHLLALAARNAPPRAIVGALGDVAVARQSLVPAALTAAARLRPLPAPGYEARVLGAIAKAVGDELEDGVAAALSAALAPRGDDNRPPSTLLPPPTPGCEWRAYFFGPSAAPAPVRVSASPDLSAAGTGAAAWPAGAALAGALLARPHWTTGAVVWELGCGCGLTGAALAVASRRGGGAPASLVLTDGDGDALANAACTLAGNGVEFSAKVPGVAATGKAFPVALAALDWAHPPSPAWPAPDLVVGADIMYDPGARGEGWGAVWEGVGGRRRAPPLLRSHRPGPRIPARRLARPARPRPRQTAARCPAGQRGAGARDGGRARGRAGARGPDRLPPPAAALRSARGAVARER